MSAAVRSSASAPFYLICLFIIGIMCVAAAPSVAQQRVPSVLEHLTAVEGDSLHLELDLTELIHEKKKGTWFPATLTNSAGDQLSLEVRARGKYRRMNCELPPLKLKFSKKALQSMGLDTLNEIKLVVPCINNPQSEANLLQEYAAYKIYEKLTPYSVRARLVKVTFRDRHVEQTYRPMWCLLVEHEEEVAARLGGKITETYGLTTDSLATEAAALNTVFQYMIGNTDWDIESFRNIYLFRPASGAKIVPIPFDFDFSGFVSAPYASVSATTGLQSVKDRLLMQNNVPKQDIRRAVQKICSMKKELLAICTHPVFEPDASQEMLLFLNDFFLVAESGKDLPKKLESGR